MEALHVVNAGLSPQPFLQVLVRPQPLSPDRPPRRRLFVISLHRRVLGQQLLDVELLAIHLHRFALLGDVCYHRCCCLENLRLQLVAAPAVWCCPCQGLDR